MIRFSNSITKERKYNIGYILRIFAIGASLISVRVCILSSLALFSISRSFSDDISNGDGISGEIEGFDGDVLYQNISPGGEGGDSGDSGISDSNGINRTIARNTSGHKLLQDFLQSTNRYEKLSANKIWDQICIEGGVLARNTQASDSPVVAIEIGMHRATQCIFAANQGMQAHCVEPSDINYRRVMRRLNRLKIQGGEKSDVLERIFTYNMAAGNVSDVTIPFYAAGSTGDHVGNFDVWNMKDFTETEKDQHTQYRHDVAMIKLDDLIDNKVTPTNRGGNALPNSKIQNVFALKVDTQGFEPAVFSGLRESIKLRKIDFILFEYWPKGMDLLSSSNTTCFEPVAILKQLAAAGYTLYALSVEAHPHADSNSQRKMNLANNGRPYDDFDLNCKWYYEFDKQFYKEGYKMGYWSDVFAVSPNAKLINSTTQLGKMLAKSLNWNL